MGDDDRSSLRAVLTRSRAAGLLGPGAVTDHIDHAAAFVAAVEPPSSFLDLGSGGGVPGLVVALAWPGATGVLLDAQERRVRFLREAVLELGIDDRVVATHGRAEDLARDPAHRGRVEVVTARSFGPPALAAECGAGFLVPGGCLVVAEPPTGGDRWPASGLAALGLADEGPVVSPAGASSGTVRRLRSLGEPLAAVPRRAAAMRRRPAF